MLVPLPPQPADVPWPTDDWPAGDVPPHVELTPLLDEVMANGPLEHTFAVVVIHRGRLVAERYGGALEHWDRPDEPVTATTPLVSWSMAKSMLHAAIGMLVLDGRLAIDERAPVPQWADPDDPRHDITIDQMLQMRDGLEWAEDYVDAGVSDVIEMLFGSGSGDVAGYAASRPLAVEPGTRFSYSSGTSNILARVLGDAVGDVRSFLHHRLFEPISMRSADPRVDEAGTWIGSSYVYATARDFARFGLLYLRDGCWEGRRLLPEGWVDHARRHRSTDVETGKGYGAHWWVVPDEPHGCFAAMGYEGQSIFLCPALDLIVVRLGKTPDDRAPLLADWRGRVAAAFGSG